MFALSRVCDHLAAAEHALDGRPDVQIHMGPWTAKSRKTGLWGISPFRILDSFSAFTMTVCQLRPGMSV